MSGDQKTPFFYVCNREQDWPEDVMFKDNLLEWTDEEWSTFRKERSANDGFDVDPEFGGWSDGVIFPLEIDRNPVLLHRCIDLAIDYCKKNEGKKLKLKEPVKWNAKIVCTFDYYITFTAEDEETHEVETYQALVLGTIPEEDRYVEMVRVKPKKRLPDASPPEGSSIKKLCH